LVVKEDQFLGPDAGETVVIVVTPTNSRLSLEEVHVGDGELINEP